MKMKNHIFLEMFPVHETFIICLYHYIHSVVILLSPKDTLSFFLIFYFLKYGSMTTRLQESWKIQNKVTYSSTIYYNYFLSR